MHGLLRTLVCTSLLYASSHVLAASVYRCEDSSGHLTYTYRCKVSTVQDPVTANQYR